MADGQGAQAGPAMSEWDNKLGLQWSDARLPPEHLFRQNVIPYFCQPDANPFYERTSNNQRVLQQNMGRADSMEQSLRSMVGVEYAVTRSQDPVLHVIQKQKRRTPTSVTALERYYIVQGDVYMCPDVMSVLHSHTSTAMFHMQKAMKTGKELKSYHPSTGYSWRRPGGKLGSAELQKFKAKSKRKGPSQDRAIHQRVQGLLHQIDAKYAIPKPASPGSAAPSAP